MAADFPTDSSPKRSRLLRQAVLVQVAVMTVFITWAFGGQSPWARYVIAWLGTAGMVLFALASLEHARVSSDRRWHPALRLLWPLWIYDALVLISLFNPGFREALVAGQASLIQIDAKPWLPTAALPHLAARELWQFNGLVLSAFNLVLVIQRRSQIRNLLFLIAGNALLLAIMGTFQKLARFDGLWFGQVKSPNVHFFATFIYHNHWGAFVVLSTAACLGLLFHLHRRGGFRDFWHSPLPLGAVATLLLALSAPLSTSRSCTVLLAGLLTVALLHILYRVIRQRRSSGRSVAAPVASIVFSAAIALGAIGFLGREVIAQRSRLTAQQLLQLSEERTETSRLVLYQDTWTMAAEKPWFGWGLESYARVFRIFNTQRAVESWVWVPFYAEAHNDWLQSLAETGFVGTISLVLLALVPLLGHLRRILRSVVPRYLLLGCVLVALYAWLEFPFANPAVVFTFCVCWYLAARHLELDAVNE